MPPEDLADAMMALSEYAAAEDYSLMESGLAMLKDYSLPQDVQQKIDAVRPALGALDWERIRAILNGGQA